MRTPKEYSESIKNGIITKEILAECLFSVNKRAKNCRDKEKQYRNYYHNSKYAYDRYDREESYREKKQNYYKQKDLMLTLISPACIHVETEKKRERIYEYESNYWKIAETEDIVHKGGYYDRDIHEYIEFVDVMIDKKKYYLFYDFGNYSFHTPISIDDLKQYPTLNVMEIGTLVTFGKEITELLSNQFVNKVIALINTGDYKLIS